MIADAISEEFPDVVLGVVTVHDGDNSRDSAEVTALLRAAEAALPGKFGATPVIEHPHIATGVCLDRRDEAARIKYEAYVPGRYGDYLPVLRELGDLATFARYVRRWLAKPAR